MDDAGRLSMPIHALCCSSLKVEDTLNYAYSKVKIDTDLRSFTELFALVDPCNAIAAVWHQSHHQFHICLKIGNGALTRSLSEIAVTIIESLP